MRRSDQLPIWARRRLHSGFVGRNEIDFRSLHFGASPSFIQGVITFGDEEFQLFANFLVEEIAENELGGFHEILAEVSESRGVEVGRIDELF